MSSQGKKRKGTASALGADALDALFSPDPKTNAVAPSGEEVRFGRGSAGSASAPSGDAKTTTAKDADSRRTRKPKRREAGEKPRKRGRPRGVGYGAKKGTRWTRSDGVEMRARSIHIPAEIDARLRRRAADEDKAIGQVIVELLEAGL